MNGLCSFSSVIILDLFDNIFIQLSYFVYCLELLNQTGPAGSVVERPLRDREVVGSNPGRAIPKALKMVPVATLLGAQHYKASTGFSSPNKISHN